MISFSKINHTITCKNITILTQQINSNKKLHNVKEILSIFIVNAHHCILNWQSRPVLPIPWPNREIGLLLTLVWPQKTAKNGCAAVWRNISYTYLYGLWSGAAVWEVNDPRFGEIFVGNTGADQDNGWYFIPCLFLSAHAFSMYCKNINVWCITTKGTSCRPGLFWDIGQNSL